MVTCVIRYVIDPYKISEFETYAKMWIPLVDKLGGKHMGYFLPHEGATNIALALFTRSSRSRDHSAGFLGRATPLANHASRSMDVRGVTRNEFQKQRINPHTC